MTAVDASIGDLLKVGEEEFDNAIKAMTVKNLMSVISGLQREMSREQEAFNSLSGELQKNKGRNSRQYKQISKDMVASQQKLTLLMNRSMKCFAQIKTLKDDDMQNSPHTNTSNSSHGGDAATGLRRRNSAKGPVAHTPPSALGVAGAGNPGGASRSAAISRSKSMHSVNHPGSPTAPQPPSLIASSSSSYSSSSTVAHAKTPGKPLVLNTSGPHKSGATSNRSSTFSSANAATANTNASDPLKPHMPIIMKPLQPNGIASTASTATSIASSFSSSSVAATSSSSTISSSTRASTSASLTPHTRVVGNLPISSALASDGIQGAANSHNNNSKGTTNVEGALGLNPASEGSCNEDVSGKGGGGGLYVKRRFGQPPSRPAASNTTFETSSSSQPVPSNTPSSSSSSSSASLPPRHPVHSRGRLQVVGSTRPAFSATSTNNTDLSPMLLSQSLSKSQGSIHHNHITELSPASATNGDLRDSSPASNDAFRGLPSVRQLAQSFGSMSALNTASASASSSANSGYTRNSRLNGGGGTTSGRSSSSLLFSPGKGVTRSSSSVGFLRGPPSSSSSSSSSALSSSPSTSVSTHRLFLTNKGSNGNNNNINGKNDAPLVQQQKLQPNGQPLQQQNSSSNHLNGSAGVQQPQPQQQQQQRPIRQPSAGRGPGSSSSFSVPASSSSAATTTEAENQLALARARLKNRNSRGITVETQNPKSESAVTSPTMESSSSNLPSQTQIPVAINEASVRQPAAAAVVTSPPTTATSSATTSTVNLNLEFNNKGNKEIKPVNHTPSSLDTDATFASSTKISSSLSSSPPTKSNNDDGINSISTSAANSSNNLRRSRSREELDQPKARLYRKSQQSGQGKETLLQQIQARRRYDDDDDEVDGGSKESNFRSISKLSMSMPSLLQTGR
ncbi:hypothetical protein RRG08_001435 [Elysia crispata]|uniref:Uncharacterized protein n=1 Tax=Elysia crispata TaxID=231223 RepID=A0AAE0ZRJ7_9GAST|nr:hypothetical protein RRG08_001435 [Elysia crispata]